MTTTIPAVRVEDLPDVDSVLACEVGSGCGDRCDAPAEWRARVHGCRTEEEASRGRCSTFTTLLCDAHLTALRDHIAHMLRCAPPDVDVRCLCNRPLRQISDMLIEVTAL